ncbi:MULTISPECIES: hypothetical protein [Burkholderia]|uniref:Uncharacterized protein n=1 Tax=Burkholderia aenigmatica TaxID=2015348 RepID=A0A6J5JM70_9BURK|nr:MULTISPECIES: hypothetical protein [Burkholderia]CAB3972277.1 hypothetical protein BLA3211_06883 [Burkholderia aenigmatica]
MNKYNNLLRVARGPQPIERVMSVAFLVWLGALIGISAFGNQ